jgi:plasmid maintenance system antidote protein VapI
VTLSKAGYRSSEPDGMIPETSQLLRKVLFGPKGVSIGRAAEELAVPSRDLSALLQGLVPVAA